MVINQQSSASKALAATTPLPEPAIAPQRYCNERRNAEFPQLDQAFIGRKN